MKNKPPKKILFFRLDSCLGDTVVHFFVLRELRKLFPHTHITLATFAPTQHIWKYNPHIDKLIVLPKLGPADDKHRYWSFPVLWGLLKMWIRCCVGGYDKVIVNLVIPTPLNRLYCRLLPHAVLVPFDYTQHITHSYCKLLRSLGAEQIDTSYYLPFAKEHTSYAQQFLQEHGLKSNRFFILNPVGASEIKRLDDKQISAIIERLCQAGFPVVLLDYRDQFKQFDTKIHRCTSTSILETAAVIAQAKGVITVDTSIVHVTDALLKPMLVLYAYDTPHTAHARHFWQSRQPTTRFLQGKSSAREIPTEAILQQVSHLL